MLHVGNLQVLWCVLEPVCGCMLATYRSYVVCLSQFGAVCWQPTGLMGCVEPVWGCMLATCRSYGVCWRQFAAVCSQPKSLTGPQHRQPTSLMGCVGASLGLYVGNLQVLWGVLEPVCGCMLATYRSYGVCWIQFAAVCWQPTCLMGCVGAGLGLYVGNLQLLWGVLGFGAVSRQPTGLMGCVGATLGLYAGNLQVLWGVWS